GEVEPPTLVYSRPGEIHLLVTRPESFAKYGKGNYEGCQVLMDDGAGGPLATEVYLGDCDNQISMTGLTPDAYYRFQTFAVLDANAATLGPGSSLATYLASSVPVFAGYDEITGEATVPDEAPWYYDEPLPEKQKPTLLKLGSHDLRITPGWRVVYNGTTTPDVFHVDRKGLSLRTKYTYRVFAINKVGTSRPIEASVRLRDLLQVPHSYPTAFPQTVVSGEQFSIRMQAVAPDASSSTGALAVQPRVDETGPNAVERPFVLSVQNVCEKDKTGVLCLLGQYWDNQWFYGQPSDTRQEALLDYDFQEGSLVANAADFVTVRWSGYLLPEFTEEYTFFAIADDTARLALGEELLFDKWSRTGGGDELAGKIMLRANEFIPIVFEYKERDGNARVLLRYSSFSTAKQVIPPDRLFRASFTQGFPGYITVTQGATSGKRTHAYGDGLFFTHTGRENRFYLQAKDAAGNNILTETDAYTVKFELVARDATSSAKTKDGDVVVVEKTSLPVNQTSRDGLYVCFYSLQVAGQYQVHVSLATTADGVPEPLAGSPFSLVASPGTYRASNSIASGHGVAEFVVNQEGSFAVHVRDQDHNALNDPFLHVNAALQWLEPVAWSPGFPETADDQDLLEAEFESRFEGKVAYDAENAIPGTYLVTYRAFREGYYDLFVNVNNEPIRGSPFRVRGYTSTTGPKSTFELPQGKKSRVEQVPTNFTVGNELRLLVQLRDAFGNALTSPVQPSFVPLIRSISFPASNEFDEARCDRYRGCNSPGGQQPCDGLRGVYECRLVPTFVSGERVISVTVNGTEVSTISKSGLLNKTVRIRGPFPIKLVPSAIAPQNSRFLSVPGTFEAGVERRIILQWRDRFGNSLPNVTAADITSFHASMDGLSLFYENNGDGTYGVDARAERATRNSTLVVSANGVHVLGSPFQDLVVLPTKEAANGSACSFPSTFIAGTPTIISCDVKDRFSNPLPQPGFLLYGSARKLTLTTGSSTRSLDDEVLATHAYWNFVQKQYYTVLNLHKRGEYSLKEELRTEGGLIACYYRAPRFQSLVRTRALPGLAGVNADKRNADDGHVGEATDFFTRVDNQVDFVWPDLPVEGAPADHFSAEWSGFLLPVSSGMHTIRVETDGDCEVRIDGQVVINRSGTKTASVEDDIGNEELQGRVELQANREVEIRIRYEHGIGTAYIRLFWSSTAYQDSVVPVSALLHPLSIFRDQTILVAPAEPHADHTLCSIDLVFATAGTKNVAYLHTKDKYGNLRASFDTPVPISAELETPQRKTLVAVKRHPQIGGVYILEFSPRASGPQIPLRVQINGTTLANVPRLTIRTGPISPPQSLVAGPNLDAGTTANERGYFNVTLRDVNEDVITDVPATTVVNTSRVEFQCTNEGRGVFACTYLITLAKTYDFFVYVDGVPTSTVPFYVPVRPRKPLTSAHGGAADDVALDDLAYNFATSSFPTEVQRATPNKIVFVPRDELRNRMMLSAGLRMLVCESSGPGEALSPLEVQPIESTRSQSTGEEFFELNVFVSSEAPVGRYSVECFSVQRGGLNALYYNNVQRLGVPTSAVVDKQVNFHFGNGLVSGEAEDYVTASWSGFLRAPGEGMYQFFVTYNDDVKVWASSLGATHSSSTSSTSSATSGSFSLYLAQNRLYAIQLYYREIVGEAALKLEWTCEQCGMRRQLVPEGAFYHSKRRLDDFPRALLVYDRPGVPDAFYRDLTPAQSAALEASAPPGAAAITPVLLRWLPPKDDGGLPITGYRIYRRTGVELVYETGTSGALDPFSWTDTGATDPQTVYAYYIVSRNVYASSYPFEILVQPTTLPSKPVPPLLQGADPRSGMMMLLLTPPTTMANTPVLYYELIRREEIVEHKLPAVALQGSITEPKNVTLYDLVPGRTYSFEVKFATRVGWSAVSDASAALCCDFDPPTAAPANFRRDPFGLQDNTTVTLTWDAVLDTGSTPLTTYRVYQLGRNQTGFFGQETFHDTPSGQSLSLTISGLTPHDTFFFSVAAVNSAGPGPRSERLTAVPASRASAPRWYDPQLDSILLQSPERILVRWRAPLSDDGTSSDRVSGYKVYYAVRTDLMDGVRGGTLIWNGLDRSSVLEVSYLPAADKVGEYFQFVLYSVNPTGLGEPTKIPLVVQAAAKPLAPGKPVAASYQSTRSNIFLRWNAPMDDRGSRVYSYRVERSLDNGLSWTDLTLQPTGLEAAANARTSDGFLINRYWNDELDIVSAQSYTYRVYAVNTVRTGPTQYSPMSTFVAASVPTTPRICANRGRLVENVCELAVATSTERSITLEFTAPPSEVAVTGFYLYLDDQLVWDGSKQTAVSFYTLRGCTTGRFYDFQLQAVSAAGASMRSAKLSRLCAKAPYAPSAPAILRATKTSLTLRWEPPSDTGGRPVTGYIVQRATLEDPNETYSAIPCLLGIDSVMQLPASETSCTDGTVAKFCGPTASCKYRVLALNGVEQSVNMLTDVSPARVLQALDVPAPPPPSQITRAVPDSPTAIDVFWSAVANATGYRLYANTGNNEPPVLLYDGFGSVTVRTYRHDPLIPGRRYRYQVTALNSAVESFRSEVVEFLAGVAPQAPGYTILYNSGVDGSLLSNKIEICNANVGQWQLNNLPLPLGVYQIQIQAHGPCPGGYAQIPPPVCPTDAEVCTENSPLCPNVEYCTLKSPLSRIGRFYAALKPQPVRNLQFLIETFTKSALTVGWRVDTPLSKIPLTEFLMYRDDGLGGEYMLTVDQSVTQVTDTNVEVGKTYRYRTVVLNDVGPSPSSVVVDFLVASAPSRMDPPEMVEQSRNLITVRWKLPASNGGSDITAFTLYRNDGIGGPMVPVFNGAALMYTSRQLGTGLRYRFQVTATNQAGESDLSEASEIRTIQLPGQIGRPHLVDSVCYAGLTTTSRQPNTAQVRFRWTSPQDNGGCAMERYQVLQDGVVALEVDATVTSAEFSNLKCASSPKFSVMGKNCLGVFTGESVGLKVPIASIPAKVKNLRAEAASDKSLKYTWDPLTTEEEIGSTDPSSIQGYELWIDDGLGGLFYRVYDGFYKPTTTTYTAENLVARRTYRAYVTAVTVAGKGNPSDTLYKDMASLPGKPIRLDTVPSRDAAGVIQNDAIVLSYMPPVLDGGSPVTNYVVQYAIDPDFNVWTQVTPNPDNSELRIVIAGLQPSRTYQFRVAAQTQAGLGGWSNRRLHTVGGPPTGSVRTLGVSKSTGTSLTWDWEVLDGALRGGAVVTGYKLYMDSGNEDPTLLEVYDGSNTPMVTAFTVQNVTCGKTYRAQVSALNQIGEGPKSNISSGVVALKPSYVPNLNVTYAGPTLFQLSWDEPHQLGCAPIANYRVDRYAASEGVWTELALTSADELRYEDETVQLGEQYTYRVSAKNEILPVYGTYSNEATGFAGNFPATPGGLSVSEERTFYALFLVQWNAPAVNLTSELPLKGYVVEVDDGFGGAYRTAAILSSTTAEATIGGPALVLTPGRSYRIRVAAETAIGRGAFTMPTVKKAERVPDPVLQPSLTRVSAESLQVSWFAPIDLGGQPITSYKIFAYDSGCEKWEGTSTTATVACAVGETISLYVGPRNARGFGIFQPLPAITCGNVPEAPTNLRLFFDGERAGNPLASTDVRSPSSLTLAWDAPFVTGGAPVYQYKLYGETGLGFFEELYVGSATRFEHAGVELGKSYKYYATAVSAVGEGVRSSIFSTGSHVATPRALFVGPTVSTFSEAQASLEWDPSTDGSVASFRVYRDAKLIFPLSNSFQTQPTVLSASSHSVNVTFALEKPGRVWAGVVRDVENSFSAQLFKAGTTTSGDFISSTSTSRRQQLFLGSMDSCSKTGAAALAVDTVATPVTLALHGCFLEAPGTYRIVLYAEGQDSVESDGVFSMPVSFSISAASNSFPASIAFLATTLSVSVRGLRSVGLVWLAVFQDEAATPTADEIQSHAATSCGVGSTFVGSGSTGVTVSFACASFLKGDAKYKLYAYVEDPGRAAGTGTMSPAQRFYVQPSNAFEVAPFASESPDANSTVLGLSFAASGPAGTAHFVVLPSPFLNSAVAKTAVKSPFSGHSDFATGDVVCAGSATVSGTAGKLVTTTLQPCDLVAGGKYAIIGYVEDAAAADDGAAVSTTAFVAPEGLASATNFFTQSPYIVPSSVGSDGPELRFSSSLSGTGFFGIVHASNAGCVTRNVLRAAALADDTSDVFVCLVASIALDASLLYAQSLNFTSCNLTGNTSYAAFAYVEGTAATTVSLQGSLSEPLLFTTPLSNSFAATPEIVGTADSSFLGLSVQPVTDGLIWGAVVDKALLRVMTGARVRAGTFAVGGNACRQHATAVSISGGVTNTLSTFFSADCLRTLDRSRSYEAFFYVEDTSGRFDGSVAGPVPV
ncbi:unnamed protein product, partial [Amoebophrya sp. A120]